MSGNSAPNYGPSANAAGGFFNMGEVGPIDVISDNDNNNYDPDAVQKLILEFLAAHPTKGMTEFQTQYVMWLMQEYGNQQIGAGAQTQTAMNKYFEGVQNLWDIVNRAEVNAPPKSGEKPENYKQEFDDQIHTLLDELKADPYMKANPGMQNQIGQNLASMQALVDKADPDNTKGVDNLVFMWEKYNGTAGSTTKQGDPTNMDSLMRQLGQSNQQFTGVSQSIGTELQSYTKNQQSEMDALNNFLKMLQSLTKTFTRGQTAGMA